MSVEDLAREIAQLRERVATLEAAREIEQRIDPERLYAPRELPALLGCRLPTVYDRIRDGRIRKAPTGGRELRVRGVDLIDHLAKC